MCGQMAWRAKEESRECVVDFGGFDAGQTEANVRHAFDQGFDQLSERTHDARGITHVRSIRPDMHTRQHDLGVVLSERARFLYKVGNRTRTVRASRQGRRAKRAMLVATILDL